MRLIAEALAGLDGPARSRVVKWALEFYRVHDVERTTSLPPERPRFRDDPALAFAGLESFFIEAEARSAAFHPIAVEEGVSLEHIAVGPQAVTPPDGADVPATQNPAQSVESMIHGFVADFQKLTADWQNE
jgi:hypothetical protein